MNLIEASNMSNNIAKECWNKIITYLTATDQSYKINQLGSVPQIIWGKFGFHTAGRYCWTHKSDHIEMNTNYLNIPNPSEFIINTTRHEVAHCINQRIGSKGVHDHTWKCIARILGDDGEIYHSYERPSNAPKRTKVIHTFYCTCGQEFNLTDRRLTSAKNGKYLCSSCKKNLKLLFTENGEL